jgi:Fur family ferric uptake transcriptional regulator
MKQADKGIINKEAVTEKFTKYLTKKNYRRTTERYKILELVYSQPHHFTIEWLYEEMKSQGLRVSRATVYNTMQLLVECNLALKHQFGKNLAVYERVDNNEHYHLVCTVCNTVKEYKDANIVAALDAMEIKRFLPTQFSLNIYGVCSSCARKQRQKKI